MKRLGAALTVVAVALACDQPVEPPGTGAIWIGFAPAQPTAAPVVAPATAVPARPSHLRDETRDTANPLVRAANSDPTLSSSQALALTGARITLSGPTPKDTTVTLGASGGSVRLDELVVGTYTVKVWGLVGDTVDSYGEATNVSVTEGAATTVNLASPASGTPWGSLRPALRPISPATTTSFTHTVHFGKVGTATGYTVEWSPSANLSSGVQSKSLTDTITTITVPDTGRYYVRARASTPVTTTPRWSDTVSARVVMSTSGGGSAGGAEVVRAGLAAVDTTIQGLNLFATALEDWFALDACRDDTLQVETRAQRLTPPSPLNTLLGLYQADGATLVASNDNLASDTTDSRIKVTVPSQGTYKIRVTQSGNTTGHYELSVSRHRGPENSGTACAPVVSLSQSTVSVSPSTVPAGGTATFKLIAKDTHGGRMPSGGLTVAFSLSGGTSNGTIGVVTDSGNGAYTATFTGQTAGTASTVNATINGAAVTSTLPTITVTAGPPVKLGFKIQPAGATAGTNIAPAVEVQVTDAFNNPISTVSGVAVTIAIANNPASGTLFGIVTKTLTAGQVQFADLRIDKVGADYTLLATSSPYTAATSDPFSITAGAAAKLAFTAQPTNTTGGAKVSPAIQVAIQDALGNTVAGATNAITLSLANNPGGAALSGTLTKNAVNGIATFDSVAVDKAQTGYTLKAKATLLDSTISAGFNVAVGPASRLAYTVEPPSTATAGENISPAVTVTVQDAGGNTVTTAADSVSVGFGVDPTSGAALLNGIKKVKPVSGVATFSNLNIDKAASGYTLAASAATLTPDSTGAFTVQPNVPAKLAFQVQPGSATAGGIIAPSVQVVIQDAFGNAVSAANFVSIAIGTNPPGDAALSGTLTRQASGGVASFDDLSINKVGTGYTLSASSTGLTGAASTGFNVAASIIVSASQSSAIASPATGVRVRADTATITVVVRDPDGNPIQGRTVQLSSTGTDHTLIQPSSTTDAGGVATGRIFSRKAEVKTVTVSVDTSVSGTDAVLTQQPTVQFIADVGAISATLSTVTANPTTVVSDGVQQSVITVTVLDSLSNPVPGQTVQLADTGAGTITQPGATNASGVATGAITRSTNGSEVITATVNPAGTAVVLTTQPVVTFAAAACGEVNATNSTVTVAPDTLTASGTDSSTVTVTVKDCSSTLMPGQTVQIAVSGSGNIIRQPVSTTDALGVATGKVSATGAGTKTVTVTVNPGASQRVLAQKPEVVFKPGPPVDLKFRVQPPTTTAGATIAPAVQVAWVDANGNTYDTTISVAVALAAGPGGAILSGTTPVAASGGIATFSNLSIQKAGTGFRLEASGTLGATTVRDTSAAFTISPAAAAALGFQVQPSNVVAGVSIAPPVEVKVVDQYGNTVTSANNTITVAIGTNAADSANGVLSGTKIKSAVSGVASFGNLNIDKAGTGYTLTAAASGLAGATSAPFNVTAGAPFKLSFKTGPVTTTAGASIAPAVEVVVQDAFGNKVGSATDSVTVSFQTDPSGSATLGGTTKNAAVAGTATFNTLSITKAATGYALKATATGLTQAVSGSFNITAAPASQLAFTIQPANAAAGSAINPAVQVTVQDPYGNTAAGYADSVTVAIANNAGPGGVLSGTKKVAPVSGVASFSTLSIDKVGSGYTLSATALGVTAATSAGFNITSAAASKLEFVVQPSPVTAGVAIAPSVQVQVQDQFGNRVAGATNAVTMALAANPGSATLLGTTTVAASDGTATFSNLSLEKAGVGYTLEASSAGLAKDTSAAFTVTAASPSATTSLVSASPAAPDSVLADSVQTATITVTVRDGFGNPVSAQSVTLEMSGAKNKIVQPAASTNASGVATGSVASAEAATKTVTATVGGSLVITQQASVKFYAGLVNGANSAVVSSRDTVQANGLDSAVITVTVRDNSNNPVPGQTVQIALSGSGNAVTQPAATTNSSGVATGAVKSIGAGTKTVTVTVNPGPSQIILAQQPQIVFRPGPPYQVGFVVQPGDVAAGAAIAPSIQAAIQDVNGNTVDTAISAITLSIAPGTGKAGAALYGTVTQPASIGIATFTGIKLDSAAVGYQLQASSGTLVAGTSAAFTVSPGPPHTVTVSPGADSIFTLGGNKTFTATARDSVGNVISPAPTFSWLSSNESVAIVNGAGTTTAVARGLATISASTSGKTGMANLAVAVRVAGIGNSFGSAPGQVFSSGDLPGTFTTLTPTAFNAFVDAASLRAQFDVLLLVSTSDASVSADWATRLRPYLALGGGIVFEDPSNVGELAPAVTGAALTLPSGGIAVLGVPNLTAGVANGFAGSNQRFTGWSDTLAHFIVRGDTALGLYGRFGNGCIVVTGPAQATDGLRGGTATQSNQYALLLNEVRFAADCPLNSAPGLASSVRVFPSGVTFTGAGQTYTARATALDAVGTPIPNAPITWSSLNDTVATVNPTTGLITSVRNGQASIKAAGSGADYLVATIGIPAGAVVNALGPEVAANVLSTTYLVGAWQAAPNNIFAVGWGGAIRRYNGVSWDTLNSGTTADLYRVWGSSGSDVFAVGANTILHYDGVGTSWTPMSDSVAGALLWDVWGSSPSDVFAVGSGGTILHYDGSLWKHMTSGTANTIYSVWGTSARNVYAGTLDAILHYDGTGWTQVATAGGFNVGGIWGSGPGDIWAVTLLGPILHFNGTSWSTTPNPAGSQYMYRVWGTSASEAFAVGCGGGGTFLRYNGSVWSQMASPASGDCVLALTGTSTGQVLAVGYQGTVWHGVRGATPTTLTVTPVGTTVTTVGANTTVTGRVFDASGNLITPDSPIAWSSENTAVATVTAATPTTGTTVAQSSGQAAIKATYSSLVGYGVITVAATGSPAVDAFSSMIVPAGTAIWDLWGPSSSSAMAVGNSGTIWRYNGTSWTADPQSGIVTTSQLYGVSGTSGSDVHAVGASGTLLHFNGILWSAQANPFGTGITHFRVWAATPTAAFAAASNGYVLKWNGTVWDTLPRATTNILIGVWGSSPADVWAVGQNGTIVRWDGTQWNTVTHSLGTTQLNAVWGTSSSNVYVVGGGSMLQCNASSCSTLAAPGLSFLWDVWGTSTSEVFVASASSAAVGRWNGSTWSTVFSGYGTSVRGVWGTSNGTVFAVGQNTSQPVLRGVRGAPVQTYGNFSQLAGSSGHGANFLLGYQVTVTDTLEMTAFGLITTGAGSQAKMGLYTDVAGSPSALVVQAGPNSVAGTGRFEYTVPQTRVLPGIYWIMAVYDVTTPIAVQSGTPPPYKYVSLSFASALPNPIVSPTTGANQIANYYIKGFQF